MPTYEYACGKCHRHTEAVQRFTDPPLTECPHCGGPLKRVFHPVGIVLKGSGFYSTDNRPGRRAGAAAKEPATTETKAETKTDTKTEAASPSKPEPSKGSSPPKK